MRQTHKPIKIGSVEIRSDELEALRIYRDYKRLRDTAGWHSGERIEKSQTPKDLLENELLSIDTNERSKKTRSQPTLPINRYGY